jgi:DNA-binding XRE family transcriptional regulator
MALQGLLSSKLKRVSQEKLCLLSKTEDTLMDSTRDKIRRLGPRSIPFPVRRALLKLGKDIREARIHRRIATAVMANRASITRMTLYKIERGNPSVSVAAYSTVLFILGMIDRFAEVADVKFDKAGRSLAEELPKSIRLESHYVTRKTKTDDSE